MRKYFLIKIALYCLLCINCAFLVFAFFNKERQNRSTNNGNIVDKAKRDVVLHNHRCENKIRYFNLTMHKNNIQDINYQGLYN